MKTICVQHIKQIPVVLVGILIILVTQSSYIQAQQSLSVSPSVVESLHKKQDEELQQKLSLKNYSSLPLTLSISVSDIPAGNQVFPPKTSGISEITSLSSSSLSLESGEEKEITLTIRKKEENPSLQYAGNIIIAGQPKDKENDQNTVATTLSIVVPAIISFNDETQPSTVAIQSLSSSGFFFLEPETINFTAAVENSTSQFEKPQGMIIIRDLTGKTIDQTPINPTGKILLSQQKREFTTTWKPRASVANIFVASAIITDPNTGEVSTPSIYVITVSKTCILTFICLVLLCSLLIIRWRKKRVKT
ncbi:MAG: hypothetical protein WCP97_07320 [bacterium]